MDKTLYRIMCEEMEKRGFPKGFPVTSESVEGELTIITADIDYNRIEDSGIAHSRPLVGFGLRCDGVSGNDCSDYLSINLSTPRLCSPTGNMIRYEAELLVHLIPDGKFYEDVLRQLRRDDVNHLFVPATAGDIVLEYLRFYAKDTLDTFGRFREVCLYFLPEGSFELGWKPKEVTLEATSEQLNLLERLKEMNAVDIAVDIIPKEAVEAFFDLFMGEEMKYTQSKE